MEGEKERQRQQREEKESNEAEDDRRSDDDADNKEEEEDEDSEGAALVWQEGYGEDNLGLPIMHWEALSLRIAELEKQEEEKKEKKAKGGAPLERGRAPVSWTEERGRRAESWEDGDDACNSHVLALTSRLQTQMNLQLCFINNSESEEEEEKKGGVSKESSSSWGGIDQVQKNPPPASKPQKPKSRGFRSTLRSLRDRLRTTDHKTLVKVTGQTHRWSLSDTDEALFQLITPLLLLLLLLSSLSSSLLSLSPPHPQTAAQTDPVIQRRHVELSDLQSLSIKELSSLCASLSQTIQDLSSELVGRLQVRDQLRTEQDAMLLEVQDLTSL